MKRVAFVCEEADVAVRRMPLHLRPLIAVGNSLAEFDLKQIQAICWKPSNSNNLHVVEGLIKGISSETGQAPKWIHSFFAGVDGLQPLANQVDQKRTVVTNGRGAFSSSLAEFALLGMLHFNKQVARLEENKKSTRWDKFEMDTIKGKTVGFLGWGSIAQHTAELLKPFGVQVICFRKSEPTSKLELAQRSDFVINTLPGTRDTFNLCNGEFFAHMKPQGVFINLGRGSTVDEDALVVALETGKLAGACLDVLH
ncbi:hypothetical protein BASA81_012826 [Batrachochytrium salamandrivorans]|nr:hypothetical protein BASA81_012826 [Batrachochytrium salamandrivorans]